MSNHGIGLNTYKQGIASLYDRRSNNYDDGEWRKKICNRLLNYSQINLGQKILDIGTGTGKIALDAAKIVGDRGKVIGVDISAQMLALARNKAYTAKLEVEFQLADAESLDYPVGYFDRILCANTFPWIENKPATLNLWHSLLKSNGLIAVHTPADTAYIGAVVLRKVLEKYGITMEASNRIGSPEECLDLFDRAGFKEIELKTERHGSYISLDNAKGTWSWVISNPSPISLKVDRQELVKSSSKLPEIKAEFDAELKALALEAGIWDEIATWYVLARKS